MKFSNYCTISFWAMALPFGFFLPISHATTQGDCSYIIEKNKLEEGLPNARCWYGTNKKDIIEVKVDRVWINDEDVGEYSSNVTHRFYGFGGDDEIYGGEYADYLDGGCGKDSEYGYDGDDILNGGKNVDTLRGDKGVDTFIDPSDKNLLVVDQDDIYPVKLSYEYFFEADFQKYLNCYFNQVRPYAKEIPEKVADNAMKFCSAKIFHGMDTAFGQFMVCRSKANVSYLKNTDEGTRNESLEVDLRNCIRGMFSL